MMPNQNEAILAGIIIHCYREFDYLYTGKEIGDILRYVKRKAKGKYEEWSAPFLVLLEDEFKNRAYFNRITDLTCSRIGENGGQTWNCPN